MESPANVDETERLLASGDYVAERGLATAVFLSLRLERPLLLEGEAGVGKTELAKVLASTLGRALIRLQCYEGLDVAAALYEWNYARQMMEIRLAEVGDRPSRSKLAEDVFSRRFLIERPLLEALRLHQGSPPVLLIDELDRADEPFEAFLLEVLSEFQVTIPELGVVSAEQPPIVVITSNRTREIHDALRRRCFYRWIGYPSEEQELEILRARYPSGAEHLGREVVAFVQRLRHLDLFKRPGIAETIDWCRALAALGVKGLELDVVHETIGTLLKYQDDIDRVRGNVAERVLAEVNRAAPCREPPPDA